MFDVHSNMMSNDCLNVQYIGNSTILCPFKMEYGPEIDTFVLKMMMKSGLEKIILKFIDAQSLF